MAVGLPARPADVLLTLLAVPDERCRHLVSLDPDILLTTVCNGVLDVLTVVDVGVNGDLVHGGHDGGGRHELHEVLRQEVGHADAADQTCSRQQIKTVIIRQQHCACAHSWRSLYCKAAGGYESWRAPLTLLDELLILGPDARERELVFLVDHVGRVDEEQVNVVEPQEGELASGGGGDVGCGVHARQGLNPRRGVSLGREEGSSPGLLLRPVSCGGTLTETRAKLRRYKQLGAWQAGGFQGDAEGLLVLRRIWMGRNGMFVSRRAEEGRRCRAGAESVLGN